MKHENLVWLRNDLRLEDNPAIFNAQQNGAIRVVFIVCIKQWKQHHESDAKIGLKLDLVQQLSHQLAQLGIVMDLLECDLFEDCADTLFNYCTQQNIKNLWFNKETPFDELNRDLSVSKKLNSIGVKCYQEAYDLIVSQPVFNQSGQPFRVFTAYYKRWLVMLENQNNLCLPSPTQQSEPLKNNTDSLKKYNYIYRKDLWPSDSKKWHHRFKKFTEDKITNYDDLRDYPNSPATSLLSPYLALGCLGPRHCLSLIKTSYKDKTASIWKADPWLRELTWRDFYRQLMVHFPHISKNQNFKSNTANIPWRDDSNQFQAWCDGQTGFPIIDAAMRQLKQTGWMHNRLRMLAASFLTKLLFIDWRKGEKYFMQNLIDGEFCANNGGWQWSASTGCDSAPYFRVFSPIRQSEKFDCNGEFIRKFVPELSSLDPKSIHDPSAQQRQQCNYSLPIVHYKTARLQAIERFKNHT